MARKRSRKKEAGVGGTLISVSVFLALAGNWVGALFLAIFAVSWWLGFEVRTTCDVETTQGRPCGNRAYGYLRACRRAAGHKRIKRAVLLSYLGRRRPAPGIMWARNSASPRVVGDQAVQMNSAAVEPGLAGGTRACVTFTCGVVSAVVAVVALVFQVLSFAGMAAGA